MKIFNCTTNITGGAIQNAVNFIHHSLEDFENEWFYFVSKEVYQQVREILPPDKFYVCESSPARSFRSRKLLRDLEGQLSPSLVYTSAGPAYVKFKSLHIMGCSNPYVLGINDLASSRMSFFERMFRWLHSCYQRFYIRFADYWIAQTELSRKSLCRLGLSNDRIFVVHNAISYKFREQFSKNEVKKSSSNSKKVILIPSVYYKHKNLEIIETLLRYLNESDYEIVLTLPDDEFQHIRSCLGLKSSIVTNIGPFPHSKATEVYGIADIVFIPSYLEVFSTSYIETMAMKLPLVLPDLDFCVDICGDYGFYYNALDESSAAACIKDAINAGISNHRLQTAHSLLKTYGSQKERYLKVLTILHSFE